jgi:para-aminobenzoate synthetase/4-amino-4-deoxychorismate lyase
MPNLPGENSIVIHHAQQRCWWLFSQPAAVCTAYHPAEVIPVLQAVESWVEKKAGYAAGFVAYEAAPAFDLALPAKPDERFPLLWFGLYGPPKEIQAPPPAQAVSTAAWTPSVSEAEYRRCIHQIKAYIQAGHTYQVNYTLRLRAPAAFDPWALFGQLVRAQGAAYSAFIDTPDWLICSASPELFFGLNGRELTSRPMKGTRARGLWADQDRQRVADLQSSEKERAENVMIVDMVRHDMSQVAVTGSVRVPRLFEVEPYPTVWQMTSTVRCVTDAGVTDIFRALFPPASITGAPKRRTMEIIAELENNPRRIYTGAIGFMAPQRQVQFNVAIRTVLIDRSTNTAEYGVGGGIVWDSTAESEFQEWQAKARILSRRLPEFDLLETLLWTPEGGLFLLNRHLARLQKSADYFGFYLDLAQIYELLVTTTDALPDQPHRVRLVVPQTGSPRLQTTPMGLQTQPFKVCLAKTPVDSSNPFLYHKTTHRVVYEQAKQACPGYDDVLLWNERGELTESSIANIIVEMAGGWYTPPVECGLLAGVYRSLLLEQGQVQERVIRVDELTAASQILLVNSVRRQWPAILASG